MKSSVGLTHSEVQPTMCLYLLSPTTFSAGIGLLYLTKGRSICQDRRMSRGFLLTAVNRCAQRESSLVAKRARIQGRDRAHNIRPVSPKRIGTGFPTFVICSGVVLRMRPDSEKIADRAVIAARFIRRRSGIAKVQKCPPESKSTDVLCTYPKQSANLPRWVSKT